MATELVTTRTESWVYEDKVYAGGLSKLRVKIKSLAAEAVIIRFEEKKHDGQSSTRGMLRGHRIRTVREESRAAQLAFAILRGVPYRVVENKAKKPFPRKKVIEIARRFSWAFPHPFSRKCEDKSAKLLDDWINA
jgi:hypothetical protein